MAKKILIVEDDKMLCTIFQMFIQELGMRYLVWRARERTHSNISTSFPMLTAS